VTPWQALELDRETARDLVRDELSRREYDAAQPPTLLRLLGRALRRIGELLDSGAAAVPGGRWGQLLLLLLLVGLVALILSRVGPLASREPARPGLFEGSQVLSAEQHRSLAEQAAAEQRWADAVRERLRAVVRDLEARGVLDPRPGRTAGEVARDAGAAVPAVADELRRAAVVFDEIWYGGRTADSSSYAALVAVDAHVREARMVLT
jgi:hypothetical protein